MLELCSNWSKNGSDRAAAVSIILPTYNRARFLPQAIESIRSQKFTDWELIIVDDGSTDETSELIGHLTAEISQPVQYIHQENQGAYAARNTGLDHATGDYIAFFDSDDLWLSHHLQDCAAVLKANQDVDWVYGACRIVDADTGQLICENSFYQDNDARQFLKLAHETRGPLRVIASPRLLVSVLLGAGLYAGLQNSLIRSNVFADARFCVENDNEAEDQIAVIEAIASGHRFAYLDSVHVDYRVHADNSSGSAKIQGFEKRLRLMHGLIRGYENLLGRFPRASAERNALRRKLANLYFWKLGYATFWGAGRVDEAIASYRCGLGYWCWDWRFWKTYAIASVRRSMSSDPRPPHK